ncbi:MAG: hypothetical protein LBG43_00175, partial [Treponema sp.]|nr:hypothetical protein [Treponema sp.]
MKEKEGGAGICAPASKGAQKSEAGFAGQVRPDGRSPPEVRVTAFMRQAGQGSPFHLNEAEKSVPPTPRKDGSLPASPPPPAARSGGASGINAGRPPPSSCGGGRPDFNATPEIAGELKA